MTANDIIRLILSGVWTVSLVHLITPIDKDDVVRWTALTAASASLMFVYGRV